ncbi:MAG: GIY-YIG nuclease family protein [Oligoflexia bacterium]|nr:GIY-YIG nuclease family protein [Oligoflexia bacterium]
MVKGKTLKIYVMGSTPNSPRSVEMLNWTGFALLGERQHLSAIRAREELCEPGIYLLLSEANETGLTNIYIGETEDFSKRIADHSRDKDWWNKLIVFVSKDQNLTKSHVKYLERELYFLAKKSIGNLALQNTKEAGGSVLPEADQSAMQEFLQNMLFILESLGLGYFSSESNQEAVASHELAIPRSSDPIEGMEFKLAMPKEIAANLYSKMKIHNGTYVLQKGSFIRREPRDSFEIHNPSYYAFWKQIIESDAVVSSPYQGALETIRDIEFRSPSVVGSICLGRSTNGRTAWRRVSDERTLLDCQADALEDAA